MTNEQQELERISPDALLKNFTAPRMLKALALSCVLTVTAIGASSPYYIYYHYIDPEAGRLKAEQEKLAIEEARRKQAEAERLERLANQPRKPAAATTQPDDTGGRNPLVPDDGKSPVEKRVDETAKPDELPDTPFDELGIGIDDTNPQE